MYLSLSFDSDTNQHAGVYTGLVCCQCWTHLFAGSSGSSIVSII